MDEQPVYVAIQEYDARRCHICGRRYPSFGFGPPLLKAENTLWACGDHRDEVGRIARGEHLTTPPNRDPQLL